MKMRKKTITQVAIVSLILLNLVSCSFNKDSRLSEKDISRLQKEGYVWDKGQDELLKPIYETKYKLESLKLLEAIEGGGGFLMFSIGEKPMYQFYYMEDDGGVKLGKIPASDKKTTVYYTSETPHIETLQYIEGINRLNGRKTKHYTDDGVQYLVFVPKDSIINAKESLN